MQRTAIVLSRSQFLAANLWVIAEVSDKNSAPDPEVRIVDVAWPEGNGSLKGNTITVNNLADAASQGYIGHGNYILPLRSVKQAGLYAVALVPASPGYTPKFVDVRISGAAADAERTARIAHEELGVEEEVSELLPGGRARREQSSLIDMGIVPGIGIRAIIEDNRACRRYSRTSSKTKPRLSQPSTRLRLWMWTICSGFSNGRLLSSAAL